MEDTLEERLAAVERALTDGDHDCSALVEGAAAADRVETLEADVAEVTDRVAELEAATQALRGYVGNVRSVNTEVEQRADLALEKAETAHRLATSGPTRGRHRDGGDAGGGVETPADPAGDGRAENGDSRRGDSRSDGERTSGHAGRDRCERCGALRGGDSGRTRAPDSRDPRLDRLGDASGDDDIPTTEVDPDQFGRDPGGGLDASGGDADEAGLLARIRDSL